MPITALPGSLLTKRSSCGSEKFPKSLLNYDSLLEVKIQGYKFFKKPENSSGISNDVPVKEVLLLKAAN